MENGYWRGQKSGFPAVELYFLNLADSNPYFFINRWKFCRVILEAFAAAVTLPEKTDK